MSLNVSPPTNIRKASSPAERRPLLEDDDLTVQRLLVDGIVRQDGYGSVNNAKDRSISVTPPQVQDVWQSNAWKLCATTFSFFFIGMNTAAFGVHNPFSGLRSLQLIPKGRGCLVLITQS